MFGGRYFAIRDRLRSVVDGIERLAEEQGVDASDLQNGGEASVHPGQPLRVVVIGDAIVGKSSLLNALFGCGVCPVGELPTRGKPIWYGGVDGPKDGFLCEDLPEGLQGDYEWIDPPGIKKWDDDDRDRLIGACGKADALLVVFHWTNPWEPATWEFLADLPEVLLERTLIVLQQTDRGETGDLPVVLQHLSELSRRRVDREFPVFPVSALRGRSAWSDGRPEPVAWRESGFDALERRLDKLSFSAARLEGIDDWWRTATQVVKRIEERIDRRARSVEDEAMFLGRIESMVEADRDARIEGIEDSIDGLDLAVGHIRRWVERRLRLVPSFFRCLMGDDTAVKLDGVVIESCETTWQLQAEADAEEMREICRERWEDLTPKVHDWLGVKMDDFSEAGKILDEAGGKFADGFVQVATAKARDIRPGAMLAEDLRFRQRTLVGWFALMLASLTVAGVLGALGNSRYAFWALAAAGVASVVVAVFTWASKRRILRAVDEGVAGALLSLGARVRPERSDEVRAYFSEFSRSLDGLRMRVVRSRSNLQPMMEQCSKLYLELRAFGHQFSSVSMVADGDERQ
jgi:hypothetical protein